MISDEIIWAPGITLRVSGDLGLEDIEDIEGDERLLFLERERERGAISFIIVFKKIKLG